MGIRFASEREIWRIGRHLTLLRPYFCGVGMLSLRKTPTLPIVTPRSNIRVAHGDSPESNVSILQKLGRRQNSARKGVCDSHLLADTPPGGGPLRRFRSGAFRTHRAGYCARNHAHLHRPPRSRARPPFVSTPMRLLFSPMGDWWVIPPLFGYMANCEGVAGGALGRLELDGRAPFSQILGRRDPKLRANFRTSRGLPRGAWRRDPPSLLRNRDETQIGASATRPSFRPVGPLASLSFDGDFGPCQADLWDTRRKGGGGGVGRAQGGERIRSLGEGAGRPPNMPAPRAALRSSLWIRYAAAAPFLKGVGPRAGARRRPDGAASPIDPPVFLTAIFRMGRRRGAR